MLKPPCVPPSITRCSSVRPYECTQDQTGQGDYHFQNGQGRGQESVAARFQKGGRRIDEQEAQGDAVGSGSAQG